jgi:hypothetical protein
MLLNFQYRTVPPNLSVVLLLNDGKIIRRYKNLRPSHLCLKIPRAVHASVSCVG